MSARSRSVGGGATRGFELALPRLPGAAIGHHGPAHLCNTACKEDARGKDGGPMGLVPVKLESQTGPYLVRWRENGVRFAELLDALELARGKVGATVYNAAGVLLAQTLPAPWA